MVEYLYDAVRAVAGQPIDIYALITDENDILVSSGCSLMLHSDEEDIARVDGTYLEENGMWQFMIPAETTVGMDGRYWYCIMRDNTNLCFKKPLYLYK